MANSEINCRNLKPEETSSTLMETMLNINKSTNAAQWGNEQIGSLLSQEHTKKTNISSGKNPSTKIYVRQGKRYACVKKTNNFTNIQHLSKSEKTVTFRNIEHIPKTVNLQNKMRKLNTENNSHNSAKNDIIKISAEEEDHQETILMKNNKTITHEISTKGPILNTKISNDHFNKDNSYYHLPTNVQRDNFDKSQTNKTENGIASRYEKDLNQINANARILLPQTNILKKNYISNNKFHKIKFDESTGIPNPVITKKPRIKKQHLEVKRDIEEAPIEILNIKNKRVKQCKQTSRKVNKPKKSDPMENLLWKDDIGTLDDTNLHFRKNEFGLYDLLDEMEYDALTTGRKKTKYNVPLVKRKQKQNVRTFTPEDVYKCLHCLTLGRATEFISPEFCSTVCAGMFKDKKHKSRPDDKLTDKESGNSEIEDNVKNSLYPWINTENEFSWSMYLNYEKSESAPIKLFKKPFPDHENAFKIGMKLEAIDPNNESYICVVTVVDIKGYRICLHFDSYSNIYNFWVNANSPNIFPVGWCKRNNHILQTPNSDFDWFTYLRKCKTLAAPGSLFQHVASEDQCHDFELGMKLEALDRKNTGAVCLATVTDKIFPRFLIHFDGQDEMYDYWVDATSPYIHPIGWCQQNNATFIVPSDYIKDNKFCWNEYLKESNSIAAPVRAFRKRPLPGFKAGMKIEAVDIRVPFLIRVATVAEVKGHSLKISFDGWSPNYSFWVDDDSPDIHPVGWCMKTGHHLEPPLMHQDKHSPASPGCGTPGCKGFGNAIYPLKTNHIYYRHCPYALNNLNVGLETPSNRLQARKWELQASKIYNKLLIQQLCEMDEISTKPKDYLIQSYTDTRIEKTLKKYKTATNNSINNNEIQDCRLIKSRSENNNICDKTPKSKQLQKSSQMTTDIKSTVFNPEISPAPSDSSRLKNAKPSTHFIKKSNKKMNPRLWTINEVRKFVSDIPNCSDFAHKFKELHIDGESFVMLSKRDLMLYCDLKLGPAMKIYNSILALRKLIPR